jgi:hypothetical protein
MSQIPPHHLHRREAGEDGGFGAEDAGAKEPGAGAGSEAVALGVGEAAFGADQEVDSLWGLRCDGDRVAAVVEEEAQVG